MQKCGMKDVCRCQFRLYVRITSYLVFYLPPYPSVCPSIRPVAIHLNLPNAEQCVCVRVYVGAGVHV